MKLLKAIMYSIVNLSQEKTKYWYISSALEIKIQEVLSWWQKCILYINRRWEYSSLVCKSCQNFYKCKNCDTSLSIHRGKNELICHTCWYQEIFSLSCKYCKSIELEKIWVGWQQIEEAIKKMFSTYKTVRFDTDTLKTKKEKSEAFWKCKESDIIIGTKMITTGLDIDNIWLIGVILLEQEIIFPAYNTVEKAFSNMSQLIGRAGRRWKTYEVVIQTFIPENEIISLLIEKNYKDFFETSLKERKIFWYPPFKELAIIEYRNKDEKKAKNFLEQLQSKLEEEKNPDYEIFLSQRSRRKYNQYFFELIIKWENIRSFLEIIRYDVMLNPYLNIRFE